jgi:Fe-Mn family superoxide dismutase
VNALEPHVDGRTMSLHHDKHHAGYVEKLNIAIEPFPELHERSASWLLLNLNKIPEEVRVAVRNSAGGHVNHSLLWRAMTPSGKESPRDTSPMR